MLQHSSCWLYLKFSSNITVVPVSQVHCFQVATVYIPVMGNLCKVNFPRLVNILIQRIIWLTCSKFVLYILFHSKGSLSLRIQSKLLFDLYLISKILYISIYILLICCIKHFNIVLCWDSHRTSCFWFSLLFTYSTWSIFCFILCHSIKLSVISQLIVLCQNMQTFQLVGSLYQRCSFNEF